jgi:hypothetical protein
VAGSKLELKCLPAFRPLSFLFRRVPSPAHHSLLIYDASFTFDAPIKWFLCFQLPPHSLSSDATTSFSQIIYTSLSKVSQSLHLSITDPLSTLHLFNIINPPPGSFTSHFQISQLFALSFKFPLFVTLLPRLNFNISYSPLDPPLPLQDVITLLSLAHLIFGSFPPLFHCSNSIQTTSSIMARVKGKGKRNYKTKSKGRRQQCRQSKLSRWLGRSASPELALDPEDPNESNRRKNLR